MSNDIDHTDALTQLALGTLSMAERRELARHALSDPKLAWELKLALRLSAESANLTRDWVRVAATANQEVSTGWRRPLAGMVASLAVAAAVMLVPWQANSPPSAPTVAINDSLADRPDRIGGASFEAAADNIGSGSFE